MKFLNYDFSAMVMNHLETVVQIGMAILIREPVRLRETGTSKIGGGFICGINSLNNPVFNIYRSGLTSCQLYKGTLEVLFWEICHM